MFVRRKPKRGKAKWRVMLPAHIDDERELEEWYERHETSSPMEAEFKYHISRLVVPDDTLYAEWKASRRLREKEIRNMAARTCINLGLCPSEMSLVSALRSHGVSATILDRG